MLVMMLRTGDAHRPVLSGARRAPLASAVVPAGPVAGSSQISTGRTFGSRSRRRWTSCTGERSLQGGLLEAAGEIAGRSSECLVRTEQAIGERVGFLTCGSAEVMIRSAIRRRFSTSTIRSVIGYSPKFADGKRLHSLIGRDKAAQYFWVGIGYRYAPRKPTPLQTRGDSLPNDRRKLGSLLLVAGRQIVLDFAELFIHDVEIVDQPFGRRRDHALLLNRASDRPVSVQEHAAVLSDDPRHERPSPTLLFRNSLRGR